MTRKVSEMSYVERAELRKRMFHHCTTNGLWDPASSYKFKPGWLDRQLQRYYEWEAEEIRKADIENYNDQFDPHEELVAPKKQKRTRTRKAK